MSTNQSASLFSTSSALNLFIKSRSIPENPIAQFSYDLTKPLLYLLPSAAKSDLVALQQCCAKLGLPDPLSCVELEGEFWPRCIFLNNNDALVNFPAPFARAAMLQTPDCQTQLLKLLQLHKKNEQLDAQIVPITLIFSRKPSSKNAPRRTKFAAKLAKARTLLLDGRNAIVRFNSAQSMRYIAAVYPASMTTVTKWQRLAQRLICRQQLSANGPALSKRCDLIQEVLQSAHFQHILETHAQQQNLKSSQVTAQATKMLDEIAADFSPRLLRVGNKVTSWAWQHLYQNIHVINCESVRALSDSGHAIIYLPCHRSHMDYLLLASILHQQGLVPAHTAAGVNLNFFPAGAIFRRCGAFFMRRSFRGDPLYSAVFREYLTVLAAKGYPFEFFIEGGRSRTGKLRLPKTGMLAMLIEAMLRCNKSKIAIIPTYIGYEHVMEVDTYANELQGEKKTQESFSDLFNVTKKLRNYGEGFVSFAQPILVHPFLSALDSRWQTKLDAGKALPTYWPSLINKLANQTVIHINRVASVNALSLCVYALLAAKEYRLSQSQLQNQLTLLIELLKVSHNGANLHQSSPAELIQHVRSLKKITVHDSQYGAIFSLTQQQAQLSHYYYNNTSHLFIIEALTIHLLLQKATSFATLLANVQSLYPLLKAEFFLALDDQKLEAHIAAVLQLLLQKELIFCENDRWIAIDDPQQQLQGLSLPIREFLQRYTTVLTRLTHSYAESSSPLTAQKLSNMLQKESA
ncbi:MAG: glycerol-3-phosphate 1-O-acyltransferase PlsB, partial [Vibrionaceae bacterium]